MRIFDENMHLIERVFIMRTKRETVEAGLKLLVQIQKQTVIRRLKGAVRWEGNLEESRTSRVPLAS